jgi:ribosome-associated protein
LATTKSRTETERPKLGTSHGGTKKPAAKGGKSSAAPAAKTKRPLTRPAASPAAPPKKAKRAGKPEAARPKVSKHSVKKSAKKTTRVGAVPESVRLRRADPAANEQAQRTAITMAAAGLDKKAVDVQILDVAARVDYADFLVLMSGRSDRHVLSIADAIEEALARATPKRKPASVEGRDTGIWVILDFGDIIAHVFQENARGAYDLESLWADARRVPLPADRPREPLAT